MRILAKEWWQTMEDSPTSLLAFNRVWTIVPEMQERIRNLSAERLVIVADEIEPAASTGAFVIAVSQQLDGRIRLEIREPSSAT